MPRISYDGATYDCEASETVLNCLGRNHIEIPSSCRTGVCQTCLMKSVTGEPPKTAQKGLKSTLQRQGYFLACVCKPEGDLEICRADDAGISTQGVIREIRPLNEFVNRVLIEPDDRLSYQPGQFLNLIRDDGLARSYSIASLPDEDLLLELHVGLVPDGRMSGWLHRDASPGDRVELQGPHGDCFYVPGRPDQPLFLLGTGTGLAPLYGIVRDALRQGHEGPIHLFHGGFTRESLYYVERLRELAYTNPAFHYHPCTFEGDGEHDMHLGYVDEIALKEMPDLKGWRVFLCGDPQRVRRMQRKAFLAGADLDDILSDSFIPSSSDK